ncbi:MAG: hypothetical protein ABIF40_01505 [archaeon]
MATEIKKMEARLDAVEAEINILKERLVDPDTILDKDDIEAIEQARKDFKEGKCTSLEDLKKEIENA